MEKGMLTYKGAVGMGESDSNAHMNVMWYVNKYELAALSFFDAIGYDRKYADKRNLGIVVLEQRFRYQKEVFENDALEIYSHTETLATKTTTIAHRMFNTKKELLGSAEITYALLDKGARKAIPLPAEIKKKLEQFKMD
ncbi:acyl-CoA thioesterase [Sediminicola luteus]|uniref:Thioesterase n=1 Tax=Sediminicola luteus TaxID=319238 RepID=A0A2A4GDG6_9FLAO|nr:thioesterase family protein [Sediminicola luteus]PCE66024.1 hypothetical protein B7P33_01610 [Sediminicola luteus]